MGDYLNPYPNGGYTTSATVDGEYHYSCVVENLAAWDDPDSDPEAHNWCWP